MKGCFTFRLWMTMAFFGGSLWSCCALLSGQTAFSPVSERTVPVLAAHEHPWARFPMKSWTRTQVITTTEHSGRLVRTLTETKTILDSVMENSLTLQMTSTVDVGGRRVETPPQKQILDFYSELVIDGTTIEQQPSTMLVVDKQLIPCEVRSYVLLMPETRQRTTVWYSTQLYPHILRVERILRKVATGKNPEEKVLSRSTTELLETDAMRLRRSKRGNYSYRTITKTGDFTTDTVTVGSWHIPGGLRFETVRELDRNGKVIRTTETRMINYAVTPLNLPGPVVPAPPMAP